MDRRDLLKSMLAAPLAFLGGRAVADDRIREWEYPVQLPGLKGTPLENRYLDERDGPLPKSMAVLRTRDDLMRDDAREGRWQAYCNGLAEETEGVARIDWNEEDRYEKCKLTVWSEDRERSHSWLFSKTYRKGWLDRLYCGEAEHFIRGCVSVFLSKERREGRIT